MEEPMKSSASKPLTADPLAERLRSERPSFAAPADFTERVMASLPPFAPAPPRKPAGLFWLPAIACASIALLVGLVSLNRPAGPVAPPATTQNHSTASALPVLKFPNISVARFEEMTARLDQPLEKELENVIHDTRGAIRFVAANFLPEN